MTAEEITKCFDHCDTKHRQALKSLYHISPNRPTACRHGALDFINDAFFAMPAEDIAQRWRADNKTVYQYVFDQTSPWQSSSRAHHAVDLILLFGGYDLSHSPSAEEVGEEMRKKWISFVNGDEPWTKNRKYAFGPHGVHKEIDEKEFASRRRARHVQLLRDIQPANMYAVARPLIAGRISLLN